jgi:hypothetical protein
MKYITTPTTSSLGPSTLTDNVLYISPFYVLEDESSSEVDNEEYYDISSKLM